jgi:hypothetical protein
MEAYANEHDVEYLRKRKIFAWARYVSKYHRFLSENFQGLEKQKTF